ncbi:carbohydrate-binding module family 18 protein [Piromyces sp. E2]|nr:carbohydrate-binding module family 18 protein [Piromyces sp. E2]|eukprot:OUM59237.1 carbohydrate-binding module family 18 protein [Piromyces sp. E2]
MSIMFTLYSVSAKSSSSTKSDDEFLEFQKLADPDNYYVIYLNNVNNKNTADKNIEKRQENDEFVDLMINEINNLIIGNKGTYEDIEKLEEIESKESPLYKRSNQENNSSSASSSLVYPIFEEEDQTVLYAYLSTDLIDVVKAMPNVKECVPDLKLEPQSYYNLDDIKKETGWSDVKVKEFSNLNLSLLSQGKPFKGYIGDLNVDLNYYYPATAGKDVDVYVIDSGFNFDYYEFANKEERTTKCLVRIDGGLIEVDNYPDGNCPTQDPERHFHGEKVSDVIGGLYNGVADKANIYGVALTSHSYVNYIKALEYIYESANMRPHKTIINMSFGGFLPINERFPLTKKFRGIIQKLNEAGAVMVASAGNYGKLSYNEETNKYFVPCAFDEVICVGGTSIIEYIDSEKYEIDMNSNFGKVVNIFAPYFTDVKFIGKNNEIEYDRAYGTSGSSPLVAGVAATIMSEHPDIEFNSTSMIKYLTKIGIKDIISDSRGSSNVLINNGKRIVYSSIGKYTGCGPNAGNTKCQEGYCCSAKGFCGKSTDHCDVGCQPKFGLCN